MEDELYIAVIGPADASEVELTVAEEIGRLLADAGAVLVCGGLGGVMEAACRGADSRGGTTIGLLPGRDRSAANPYVRIALPTGLGQLRNGLVVGTADAVIAVGGGWGTLSEIALAMRADKRVVAVRSWRLEAPGGMQLRSSRQHRRGGRPTGAARQVDPMWTVDGHVRLARFCDDRRVSQRTSSAAPQARQPLPGGRPARTVQPF